MLLRGEARVVKKYLVLSVTLAIWLEKKDIYSLRWDIIGMYLSFIET